MKTTGKSKNATSTGDSTDLIPGATSPSRSLARRVLFQAAKDQSTSDCRWLDWPIIRQHCHDAGISYRDYADAIRHLARTEGAQRRVLLQNFKKRLGF